MDKGKVKFQKVSKYILGLKFSYSELESVMYVDVTKAVCGCSTKAFAENKVLAVVGLILKYKSDVPLKAAKLQDVL